MSATTVDRCRVCGGTGFETVVDLGEMPLANAFLDRASLDGSETRYPLCAVDWLSALNAPRERSPNNLPASGVRG